MQIRNFEQKLDAIRRYRSSENRQPARVTSAMMGSGYRITLVIDGVAHMFSLTEKELPKVFAAFPGVTELWRLFD